MKNIDYSGKKLKCITNKYGNYTKDKLYDILSRHVRLDGTPSNFYILDDEGDTMYINHLLNKRNKWLIVD